MSSDHERADAHVEVARVRIARWLGVDLRRGALARGLERHVAARLGALGRPSPERWAALLDDEGAGERRSLVEAVTVPHSWLWRDPAQLAALGRALSRRPRSRLRVWVAGCASGEDAYTIAALALGAGHEPRVLATDVNVSALERARRGRFGAWAARELPHGARALLPDDGTGGAIASEPLRACVTFTEHSLLDDPPEQAWDVIVCRNVLIYFEHASARRIVDRLADALAPAGLLALGASDVLADLPETLAPAGADGRAVLVRCEPGRRRVVAEQIAFVPVREAPVHEGRGRVEVLPPTKEKPSPAVAAARDLDPMEAETRAARDPADAEAQLVAGIARFSRGEFEAAIEPLRAAACLAPGAWAAWLYLGLASERLGRWVEARRSFRRAADARGVGEGMPEGTGEIAETLRAARPRLLELARDRARALEEGPDTVNATRGTRT